MKKFSKIIDIGKNVCYNVVILIETLGVWGVDLELIVESSCHRLKATLLSQIEGSKRVQVKKELIIKILI